jgi:hypothetical protein
MSNNKYFIKNDKIPFKEFVSDFKDFVLNNICQCQTVCEKATEHLKKQNEINGINCTQIKVESTTKAEYYYKLYDYVIQSFVNNDILIKEPTGTKFYILKNNEERKLTWENIKSHESLETRELLWLFRKLIVDTLIKYIITTQDLQKLIIYSVGSNELTSDYDITLYGSNESKVKMITEFNKLFKDIFGNPSSLVFDTNIYGKACIEFENPNNKFLFTQKTCGKENFYYLNGDDNKQFTNSTIIWALIKFFREIRDAFGEDIYNKIYIFMKNKNKQKKLNPEVTTIYEIVHETLLYLRNQDETKVTYESVLQYEEYYKSLYSKYFKIPLQVNYQSVKGKEYEFYNEFYLKYKPDNFNLNYKTDVFDFKAAIQFENDNISLINFFGEETYFTRGAFLDTVVNSQICSNKNIIQLTETDYITSIIENSSFFFIHNNKTKYLQRVIKSFKILSNYGKNETYTDLYNSYEFNYMNNIITKELYTQNTKYIKDFISNLPTNINSDILKELKTKITNFVNILEKEKVIKIDNKATFNINDKIDTSLLIQELNTINKLSDEDYLVKIKFIFSNLENLWFNYKYCTIVSDNYFNLLDCEKYSISQCLLWFIYKLTINIQQGEITFPFYDIFISEKNMLYIDNQIDSDTIDRKYTKKQNIDISREISDTIDRRYTKKQNIDISRDILQ